MVATAAVDRECQECPAETYADAENMPLCKPWTVCAGPSDGGVEQGVVVAGGNPEGVDKKAGDGGRGGFGG